MPVATSPVPPNGRIGFDGVERFPVQVWLPKATILAAQEKAKSRVWPACRSRAAVIAKIAEDHFAQPAPTARRGK